MKIRTRFAPSPTGYLHIGGVRTALYNYLFAKKHGGQFILRIDDTDQQRNVEEALQPILDGLHWLGIDWDEGPEVGGPYAPYYQSQRSDKYQAAVDELLKRGFAYRDFASTEEIQAERDAAVAEKRTFTYSRRWMAETDADVKKFESEGRKGVVRLKMPREGQYSPSALRDGKLVIHDLIRGDVEFNWADEQDHVIQRADGSFIYHLANVVDDEEFRISHVIRAEEHLSNTPRQIFMIQSLGYKLPEYAHLPFVAEPGSKTKLSKRKLDKYLKNKDFAKLMEHGKSIASRLHCPLSPLEESPSRTGGARVRGENSAQGYANPHPNPLPEGEGTFVASDFNPVIVDFYRTVGYLPEAIVNAMVLVGWALDDKTEFFLMDDLIKHFSLEGVTKGAASFDPAKLFAFQEKHMATKTVEEKVELCNTFLVSFFLIHAANNGTLEIETNEETGQQFAVVPPVGTVDLKEVIRHAGDRIKVAGDILDFVDFFLPDDEFSHDESALAKRITDPPEAIPLLRAFRDDLAKQEDFSHAALEQLMQNFLEAKQIKMNQIIHALRVAVTGKSIGLGLFETLEILGKERTLRRMDRTLGN